jgi:peptidoglycan/xylan/chitin deacetylase (PgdA/CDA1 family)
MERLRDFIGYGETPPSPRWPGNARIAINLSLNFEGGGERSVADGDACSEFMLTDFGAPRLEGLRNPLAESIFEYGSRVGVWRVLRVLREYGVKASVLGVIKALERNPDVLEALLRDGHEFVCHGYRWLDYHSMPLEQEREHVVRAVEWIGQHVGAEPFGWMTGRPSLNTRSLIAVTGRVLYDRDELNDELPYWVTAAGRPHLVIPYSFEANDNRFDENNGFSVARHFSEYLIDSFDTLYAEGATQPALLSIAVHDRLIGRPGRIKGLADFLGHASGHSGVWFCTGREIAQHWRTAFPAPTTV